MSANPTVDQLRLLNALVLRGPTNTGDLARTIAKTPRVVAHLLLPLRLEGIVFSTRAVNDQHVTWELTNYGREWLVKNYPAAVIQPAPIVKPQPKEQYILWCPTSSKAPQVTYPTLAKAKEVQKIMADRNHGHVFHICEVGKGLKVEQHITYVEV